MSAIIDEAILNPPEGMIATCRGALHKRSIIKDETLLEHDTVVDLVTRAQAMSEQIKAFKQAMLDDVTAFLDLLAERYKVRLGGKRGGVALHSFDLLRRVEISIADTLTFGPELEAAKALIDECLNEWTTGGNENLRAVVMEAFDVGEGKKLQVDRILGLRRLKIDDDRWTRAMEAITDALRVAQSRQYIRFYARPNFDAKWVQIPLDMSRI